MTGDYDIESFIVECKSLLGEMGSGEEGLKAIGGKLKILAQRSDLLSLGRLRGRSDSSVESRLLHREVDGSFLLLLSRFAEGRPSPIHNHGTWGVICGYTGHDRQTLYERIDDGAISGFAEIAPKIEVLVGPGDIVVLPDAPLDIHSHAAESGSAWALILQGKEPDKQQRKHFDMARKQVRPAPQVF